MGIRADITPQAARIDAHCLNKEGPVRLCYADSVLHTKPRGLMTSRVPIRVGAELYGHSGVECDIELICLMHQTLDAAAIGDIHIVLGHVGIFRTLVKEANLSTDTETLLFEAVQRKAYGEIDEVLDAAVQEQAINNMIKQLARLSGGEATLSDAIGVFAAAPVTVQSELAELVAIVAGVKKRIPDITLCFDLCELRGYEYHTGIVFAAYTPDYGRAVAKGGRYDDIGEVFGRARPASGFDSDLKTLAKLTTREFNLKSAIAAPYDDSDELLALLEKLRDEGEVVISSFNQELSEQDQRELDCDRRIVQRGGMWVIEKF
jgi:ATP phosphoribosyltransferase regulatory subunit